MVKQMQFNVLFGALNDKIIESIDKTANKITFGG
jgi:hypothetical protein